MSTAQGQGASGSENVVDANSAAIETAQGQTVAATGAIVTDAIVGSGQAQAISASWQISVAATAATSQGQSASTLGIIYRTDLGE